MRGYDQHFAQLAQRYDTLRRDATDEQADRLIAAGGLQAGQGLEYEAGLARAERDTPEAFVSDLTLLDLRCDTR